MEVGPAAADSLLDESSALTRQGCLDAAAFEQENAARPGALSERGRGEHCGLV
jgi:hypothetical protein